MFICFWGNFFLLLIKTRKGNPHPHRVQYPTQQFFLVKEIWCQRIIPFPIKIAIKLCRSNPFSDTPTHPKIIYRKCGWWYNYIFHHIPISYAISYSILYATISPLKKTFFMEAKPQLVHWWSPMGPWGASPKNRATPLDFHCNRRLQWPHRPTTTFSPNVLLLVWLLNQHKSCFSMCAASCLVFSKVLF